jgi:hypothetical protein
MRSLLTRLWAGVFLCLALAGCPIPAPAKPAPAPQKPAGDVLWYAHADGPDAIQVAGPKAQDLQAIGIGGVVVSGSNFLRYAVTQHRRLSLDEVGADLKPVVSACAPLPVWLEIGVSSQDSTPPRTLYAPKDAAQRGVVLDNLATVGQAAKEAGIPAVGFDFEAYGVSQPYAEKAEQLRVVGVDLATALRRNYGAVRLFGFCPLSFYRKSDGARGLFRGFYSVAGQGGVFFNEDSYGLSRQNVKQLLSSTADFTHCAIPACGWWPDGNAPDPVAAISAAAKNWKLAVQDGRPGMLYHEGLLLTTDPGRRGALGQVLGN